MTDLAQLLTLQDLDTTVDQLRHRRASLPERARLAEVTAAVAALDEQLAATTIRRDELARSQRRLEDEIEALTAKSVAVDRTLYSGTVTSPRELTSMQEELTGLGRRRSRLEDDVLELMEEREPLDAAVDKGRARRADLEREAAELQAALAEAEAAVDAELAATAARREELVAGVPAPLLAEYERLRSRLGGVAVAPLQGGRMCGGCNLTLSAVEIDRLKREPAGTLVHCEECGRILVR